MSGSRYLEVLKERVLVFDGAMGTSIQQLGLGEADFGGPGLDGCNDHLVLSRPDAIEEVHASFLDVSITLEIIAAPIDLDAIFTALASLLLLCGTLMSLNARSGVTEWGVLQLGSSVAWSDIESYRWEHFEHVSLLRLERVDAAWLRKDVQVLVQPDYVARIDHVLADRLHQPASRSGR